MAASEEHEEQQQEEVEALEAIFEEKLTVVKSTAPRVFDLVLLPVPDGDESENHVGLTLRITHTPDYPDTPPLMEFHDVKGLTSIQQDDVLALAKSSASDMAGMAVGMQVAESVREWLEEHNEPASDGSMYAQMMERQKRKDGASRKVEELAEREALLAEQFAEARRKGGGNRHLDRESLAALAAISGTRVTKESFAEWRARFRAEAEATMAAGDPASTGRGKGGAGGGEAAAAAAATAAADGSLEDDTPWVDSMGALGRVIFDSDASAAIGKCGREMFESSMGMQTAEAEEVAAAAAALKEAEAGGAEAEAEAGAAAATGDVDADAAAVVGDASVFMADDDDDLDELDELDGLDEESDE